MKIRSILRKVEAVPIALGLIGAVALSACQATSFDVTAKGTVAPVHSASTPASPAPASPSISPSTESPMASVSPSASIPGATPQPTQTVVATTAQVQQCLAPVISNSAQQTSVQLESAQTWGNLDGCLQVPTAEFDRFVAYVIQLVIQAEQNNELSSVSQCSQWEQNTLTPVVQSYDRQ